MFSVTEWPTIMSVSDCCEAFFVGTSPTALAQDEHAVGHVEHLVELVGDDDERLAVGLHRAHDAEETVRLWGSARLQWLIEDQDIRPAVEHLHDLDGLLL